MVVMLKIVNDNSQEELTCYSVYENVQRVFFKLHVFIFLISPFFLKGEPGMPSVTLNRSLMRNVADDNRLCVRVCRQRKHCKPWIWAMMERMLSPVRHLSYSAGHQSATKM